MEEKKDPIFKLQQLVQLKIFNHNYIFSSSPSSDSLSRKIGRLGDDYMVSENNCLSGAFRCNRMSKAIHIFRTNAFPFSVT